MAVVKGTLVAFPVDLGGSFAGVTFDLPAGTAKFLVTGLAPGGDYDVTIDGAGGNVHVTVQPGSAKKADGGGVLSF